MNELLLSSAAQPVVCSCDCMTADKSFFHSERIPDYNTLIYVIKGTMYISEDGTDYEVGEGELLFLKRGLRHYGVKETRSGTKWYFVLFHLDDPDEGIPLFEPNSAPLMPGQPLYCFETLPKKLSGLKNGQIERSFSDFVDYCRVGDDLKRMKINGMFYSLLADIALEKYADKYDYSLSYRIRSWLEKHYDEPFSAQKLEKEFFLGYKRMAAVFKEEYGISMQQYHNKQRMQMAANLLKTTALPVGDIAAKLGFDDRLYFSRCFHAFSGVSPKEYRQSAESDQVL